MKTRTAIIKGAAPRRAEILNVRRIERKSVPNCSVDSMFVCPSVRRCLLLEIAATLSRCALYVICTSHDLLVSSLSIYSMPPPLCVLCKINKASLKRPKTAEQLCKDCFFYAFEEEIHQVIEQNRLFQPGESVADGASGGKGSLFNICVHKRIGVLIQADSTVLAEVMTY